MSDYVGQSELSRELGCRARDIPDLIYAGKLDGARFPIVSGRRLIPRRDIPEIVEALRRAGKLPQGELAHA